MGVALPKLWPTTDSGKRMGRYARARWPWPVVALFYVVLAALSMVYGYTFGIFSNMAILPFAVPLVVLAILLVWTMPDLRHPPVRMLSWLLTMFVFALLVWPLYIALTIGNLPWLTAVRLTAIPMTAVLLVCYVASSRFRGQMKDIIAPSKLITYILLAYTALQTVLIVMSKDIPYSVQQYVIFIYADIAVFFGSVYYFNKASRIKRFAIFLVIITAMQLACGFYEIRFKHLPWVGHIPSFLTIEDPLIIKLLEGSARAATGIYRVQSKFTTSIGLGEYFGLSMPFLLHLFFASRSRVLKAVLLVMLPCILVVTLATQSRLAFVCYVASILLYILFRSVLAWRNHPQSLFAPAVALAYPMFLALVLAATFLWHRLSLMVWGGGAEQASTQSRKVQWAMTWPKVFHNPFGYGIGQSGGTLAYIAPGFDQYTVDSYYISVLLDSGILGFVLFYGMFAVGIARAGLTALKAKDEDVRFLIAASIALTNFVLSKSVYSQTENHPLAFMILGMVVALIRQYKTEIGELPPPPAEQDLASPSSAQVLYRR